MRAHGVAAVMAGVLAVGLAVGLASGEARAQAGGGDAANGAPAKLVEVRFALSSTASKQLSEPRLRRLLEIELGDDAVLAPAAMGPLGDHVAYVWVDLMEPSTLAIEVRVGARPVDHREIADAELTGDIVARVIAIAAADMVRRQMRPIRPPPKPPAPKPPSAEAIEAESQRVDALMWAPRVGGAFVPSAGAAMFGPELDLGFRRFGAGAHVLSALYAGPAGEGSARWFEAGLGMSYRLWVTPSLRFAAELSAAMVSVRVQDARIVGGEGGMRDDWTARAGGAVAIEWRAAEPVWLTLGVGPSAVLRPIEIEAPGGARGAFDGAFVGASLGVLFEQRFPVHVKGLQASGMP
ncbi:MAG: hypothetical protein R3B70_22370 [Polyangiaceae bacterium]